MIVLDASVLIAHSAGHDVHGAAAFDILDTDEELFIHPLNLAEYLVGPTRIGSESLALGTLDRLGVRRSLPAFDEPVELARLRAKTGLKLPDCCVLVAALQLKASVATFDERLARAARELGLVAVGA